MTESNTCYDKVQGDLCEFWLDDKGVFHMSAKDEFITIENLEKDYQKMRTYLAGKKVPVVYDATKLHPIERRVRLRLEEILIENFTALGVVSKSKIGLIVARIFFSLSNNGVPKQIFSNIEEAEIWALKKAAA